MGAAATVGVLRSVVFMRARAGKGRAPSTGSDRGVARSYLVCATPRSGSTLLCEALSATGVAGRPAEYFEAMYDTGLPRRPTDYFEGLRAIPAADFLADQLPVEGGEAREALAQAATYRDYLAWVYDAGTTPNGAFGAKLMWGHVDHFVAYLRDLREHAGVPVARMLERVFPSLSYLRVVRRDRLRQAVSLWRALQTATWRVDRQRAGDEDAETPPLKFSFDAIDYLRRQLAVQEAAWDDFFASHGIEPLRIVYEDLVADAEETLQRVLLYVDASPDKVSEAYVEMTRQSDSISDEWVERYRRGETERERH